jgi:hypothetical protein
MSEELKLTVTRALGGYERQFAIESNHSELDGEFEDRYVLFSGYFGPYKPELFAAAPDLLEALREMTERGGWMPSDERFIRAQAAIAKAEGRAE